MNTHPNGLFGESFNPLEYANFTNTPFFIYNNDESLRLIKGNVQTLINAYHDYEFNEIMKAKRDQSEYDELKRSFETKTCAYCKAKLVYRQSYDFWGCSNYKEQGRHTSISGKEPSFYVANVRITRDWVSDIIRISGFRGKIKAKQLYKFYIDNDLADLRSKYGRSNTGELIDNLVTTKKRSASQEIQAKDYLCQYGKVAYQQCITYKFKNSKETFCIPDFILGTPEYVKVFDAKLDVPDDTKMDLYVYLVEWIMRSKNDKRPVSGGHVFYKQDDDEFKWVRNSKHETIEILNIDKIL